MHELRSLVSAFVNSDPTSLAGRQHLGAMFNLVAYYVLALPMGITLAFHSSFQLGLQGLWIGKSLSEN